MKYLISFFLGLTLLFNIQAQEYLSHTNFETGLGSGSLIENGEFIYQVTMVTGTIDVGPAGKTTSLSVTSNNLSKQVGIIKYDKDFNVIWSQVIARSSNIFSTIPRLYFTEEYVILTYLNKNGSAEFRNIDIVDKDDPSRNFRVARLYSENGITNFMMDVSPMGRVAMVGRFRGNLELTAGTSFTESFTQSASSDAFVATLDNNYRIEQFRHLKRGFGYPGLNNRAPFTLKFQEDESLTMIGQYEGSIQVDNLTDNILRTGNFETTQGVYIVQIAPNSDILRFEKYSQPLPNLAAPAKQVGENLIVKVGEFIGVFDKSLNPIDARLDRVPIVGNVDRSVVVNDHLITANLLTTPITLEGSTLNPNGVDILLVSYNSEGEITWYNILGGDTGSNVATSLITNQNGGFSLLGFSMESMDLDFSRSQNYSGPTSFLVDYIINCQNLGIRLLNTQNVSCTDNGEVNLEVRGGSDQATLTWLHNGSNEPTQQFDQPGVYEVSVQDTGSCSRSIYVPVGGPKPDSETRAFLRSTEFRSGFDTELTIDLSNKSCGMNRSRIELRLNEQLTYLSSDPAPDQSEEGILTFNVEDLNYDSGQVSIKVMANLAAEAQFGTELCNYLIVYSENGEQLSSRTYCQTVINSYDPNDIQVYPSGRCDKNYYTKEESLEYLIRFQNLGNAEAINVVVADTLDSNHDITTLVINDASHSYRAFVEEDSILILEFIDINLPAEEQDEAASNGYIRYTINTFDDLQEQAVSDNQAAIYFDFNPPVITNEVESTLVNELPDCIISKTKPLQPLDIQFYPNPNKGIFSVDNNTNERIQIKVYDVMGRVKFTVNLEPGPTAFYIANSWGLHLLEGKNSDGAVVWKEKVLVER